MKLSHIVFGVLGLGVSALALAHGGDGHDHPVEGASQMPASFTGSDGGGGGSTSIQGSINLSQPSIKSVGGGGSPVDNGGGGESVAAPEPVYPHLSTAKTVPNDTSRSVPGYDGATQDPTRLVLDRYSIILPRTDASIRIYENAYRADQELMNKWTKTLGR